MAGEIWVSGREKWLFKWIPVLRRDTLITLRSRSVDIMHRSADFTLRKPMSAFDFGLLWQHRTSSLQKKKKGGENIFGSLLPLALVRRPPGSCRTPESRRAHAVAKVGLSLSWRLILNVSQRYLMPSSCCAFLGFCITCLSAKMCLFYNHL